MSDQQQFKPGDLVELQSGGPRMTVTKPSLGVRYTDGTEANEVLCEWFDAKASEFKSRSFPSAALRLAKTDEQIAEDHRTSRARAQQSRRI